MASLVVFASYASNMVIAFIVLGAFIVIALIAAVFFVIGLRQSRDYVEEALPTIGVQENLNRIQKSGDNSFDNISTADLQKAAMKKKIREMGSAERTRFDAKAKKKRDERNMALPTPVFIGRDGDGVDAADNVTVAADDDAFPMVSVDEQVTVGAPLGDTGTNVDDYGLSEDDLIIVDDAPQQDDAGFPVPAPAPEAEAAPKRGRHARHSRPADMNPFG